MTGVGPAAFDSDDEDVGGGGNGTPPLGARPCHCQYNDDERWGHLADCQAWPGPFCGTCWAATCECGYTFETIAEAAGRWRNGRLRCAACAPEAAVP